MEKNRFYVDNFEDVDLQYDCWLNRYREITKHAILIG